MKMNQFFFAALLVAGLFSITSCGDDDDDDVVLDYHAHIMSPDASDKHVGDTISINIEFEEHNGEAVHHVNVRIYNKDDNTEVYNMPTEAHVHEMSGTYVYTDDFVLDVDGHSNWVMEAKVWGHEAGLGEVVEMVEFHVHP